MKPHRSLLYRSLVVCTLHVLVLRANAQVVVTHGSSDCVTSPTDPDILYVDPTNGIRLEFDYGDDFYYVNPLGGGGNGFYVYGATDATLYGSAAPFDTLFQFYVQGNSGGIWITHFNCYFRTIAAIVPANDDDCSAIELNSSITCTPLSGTLSGATATLSNYSDVWYSFVAGSQTYTTIYADPAGTSKIELKLYSGFCSALTELVGDASTYGGSAARLDPSALVEGQTYYVMVAALDGASAHAAFDICLLGSNTPFDCELVEGGGVGMGSPCDDGNPCTITDLWDGSCHCVGTFADADGDGTCDAFDHCPGGPEPGAPCDDPDPCTYADMYGWDCQCAGILLDSDDDGTPDCNDNCPFDQAKTTPGDCGCNNADTDSDNDGIADCKDRCPGVDGTWNSTCNDGNDLTVGDHWTTLGGSDECVCLGVLEPLTCIPGEPCGDPCSNGSIGTWSSWCECLVASDEDNDGLEALGICDLCPGLEGTWDSPCLVNGYYPGVIGGPGQNFCECWDGVNHNGPDGDGIVNPWDDCPLTYGMVGSPCQDGDPNTINDVLIIDCACAGCYDMDTDGICDQEDTCPDLFGMLGDPCDDGINWTYNDSLVLNGVDSCICQGEVITGLSDETGAGLPISVFPNPATDVLDIRTDGVAEMAWIELLDAQGRVLRRVRASLSKNAPYRLNLGPDVPSGMYTVRVTTPDRHREKSVSIMR